jgi:hypothetical protein
MASGTLAVSGLAVLAAAGPATIAGADTPTFDITCTVLGNTVSTPTVVTGSLPALVGPGAPLTLSNYSSVSTATIPYAEAKGLAGKPLGFVTATAITGTGTVQSSQNVTTSGAATVPFPVGHNPVTFTIVATGTPPTFTAAASAGTATLSTAPNPTVTITLNGQGLPPTQCTASAEPIASTTIGAPQVASLSPIDGPVAGGTPVTITGAAFTGATVVKFGTAAATNVHVVNDTTITATSPPSPVSSASLAPSNASAPAAGVAGQVDVTVAGPLGTSTAVAGDKFTYTNAPIVNAVVPNAGPIKGGTAVTITGQQLTGVDAVSFGNVPAASFQAVSATEVTAVSPPAPGNVAGTVDVTVHSAGGTSLTSPLDHFTYLAPGYWEVGADGGVFAQGATFYGSMGGKPLNAYMVGIASSRDGQGYVEVGADGGAFTFGDEAFAGSMAGKQLNAPVVGVATDPATGGYWEVAADGGVFNFNAPFEGSMGGKPLNAAVDGIVATPDGGGYTLVARDGGTFTFGDAKFEGSEAGQPLNRPVVGAAMSSTGGVWEAAGDGAIFAFHAPFDGNALGLGINAPVLGLAASSDGGGYFMVGELGAVYAFGDAKFTGDMAGKPLNAPMVGIAVPA